MKLQKSKLFVSFVIAKFINFRALRNTLECGICRIPAIGHFHDGVILLQLPEFISFSFSNSNFVIPVDSKEQ